MATKKKPVDGATDAEFEDIELEAEVSDRVLEDTPERVIRFVLAARQHPHIYRLLYARGYNRATVREAWVLLDKLGGVTAAAVDGEDDEPSDDEKAVAKAISETLARIREAGRVPGMPATSDNLAHVIGEGCRYIYTHVPRLVGAGAQAFLGAAKR